MKIMKKAKIIGTVFKGGVKTQLKQEWTIGAAATIGLTQGLKYGGSIKRGVIGGAATLGVLAVANGVYNVVSYWDDIGRISEED